MTLTEFIEQEKARLEQFRAMWLHRHNEVNTEHYPMDMEPGEWDEQMHIFDNWPTP